MDADAAYLVTAFSTLAVAVLTSTLMCVFWYLDMRPRVYATISYEHATDSYYLSASNSGRTIAHDVFFEVTVEPLPDTEYENELSDRPYRQGFRTVPPGVTYDVIWLPVSVFKPKKELMVGNGIFVPAIFENAEFRIMYRGRWRKYDESQTVSKFDVRCRDMSVRQYYQALGLTRS